MTTSNRLRIKQEAGWFVAGDGVKRALEMLSDGAFRLFAWLCVNAHRPSGQLEATHKELSATLGKSRRALGSYIAELEQRGICRIERAANQHARTMFEITDAFWPYERYEDVSSDVWLDTDRAVNETRVAYETQEPAMLSTCEAPSRSDVLSTSGLRSYVASVREMFLALACGKGSFSPVDKETATDLVRRGVPLEVVRDAFLVGEARKYVSWLNNGDTAPIGSLKYFAAVIDELQRQPIESGYREYLEAKIREFRQRWHERRRVSSGRQKVADPTRRGPRSDARGSACAKK